MCSLSKHNDIKCHCTAHLSEVTEVTIALWGMSILWIIALEKKTFFTIKISAITLYVLPFSSVQKSVYVNPCNCAPVQPQNCTEVMFTSSDKNVGLFILRVFSQL